MSPKSDRVTHLIAQSELNLCIWHRIVHSVFITKYQPPATSNLDQIWEVTSFVRQRWVLQKGYVLGGGFLTPTKHISSVAVSWPLKQQTRNQPTLCTIHKQHSHMCVSALNLLVWPVFSRVVIQRVEWSVSWLAAQEEEGKHSDSPKGKSQANHWLVVEKNLPELILH